MGFPKLGRLAKKQVAIVENPDLLLSLIVNIEVAQSAEEIEQHLLALDEHVVDQMIVDENE